MNEVKTVKQLEKELKAAKAEILEDRQIKDEMIQEINKLKKQLHEGKYRGYLVNCFLKSVLHQIVALSGNFGIDVGKELEIK